MHGLIGTPQDEVLHGRQYDGAPELSDEDDAPVWHE